ADPALRYETVVTDDFRAHMEAASGMSLGYFFDQWLTRASRPNFEWSWTSLQSGGDAIITINVEQVQADSVYVVPIDFEVTFSDASPVTVTVENTTRVQQFQV